MNSFSLILIGLIIGFIICGVYPLFFIFVRSSLISKHATRLHCFLSCIIVNFAVSVFSELSNGGTIPSFATLFFCILYGLVCGYLYYQFALSRFRKRGILLEIPSPSVNAANSPHPLPTTGRGVPTGTERGRLSAEPQEVSLSYTNDFQVPVHEEDANGVISDVLYVYKTPKRLEYALIVLAVLFAASLGFSVWHYSAHIELSSQIKAIEKEHSRELSEYYDRGYRMGYDTGYDDGYYDGRAGDWQGAEQHDLHMQEFISRYPGAQPRN